jgi:hypothetical protein
MLGFAYALLGWSTATAMPAFLGLLVITGMGRWVKGRHLSAFALGIFMWFFVDTIGGSANLDVNAGFTGGVDQVAIVALFVVGVLFFFSVGGDVFSPDSTTSKLSLTVPILVAIAVAIHGFGEGTAFGGLSAGVAYALHKALEPMMIGASYVVFSWDRAKNAGRHLGDILLLTVIFVVPSLIGATTGYFINYDATYFFALGTGTSIYAAMRLAKPLFADAGNFNPGDSIKVSISLVLGFLSIYFGALFHS